MSRIVELKWDCGECSTTGILGRHKSCPSCGSPREKGEMKMGGLGRSDYGSDGRNKAATVTNPELLKLAHAGSDWFCSHCGSGNRGDGEQCVGCAAPRYGKAEENHPAFPSDHKKVVIGDDPWEDGFDPELGGIAYGVDRDEEPVRPNWDPELGGIAEEAHPTPTPPRRKAKPQPRWQDAYEEDPAEDYLNARRKTANAKVLTVVVAVFAAFIILAGSLWWAFTTHEVEGLVTGMSWHQNTLVQTWTQTTSREWEDDTTQRSEVEPRNGSGERAGMEKVFGSCDEEHHHDEEYVCGSHEECTPRTRPESYVCGETCSDNGNGFATCVDRTCTRDVPDGEDCRTVDDYCDRPIYETRCTYKTQVWNTTRTLPSSGSGRTTTWPKATRGRLDRLRYSADY